MSVAEDIKALVRLQLGIASVEADQVLTEDLGAVSADILNIVVAIEDKYDIEIEESALADARTVADLIGLVESGK